MDYKALAVLLLVGVIGLIQARYHYPPNPYPNPHPGYSYWSPWSYWARCNVRCGGGTQSRARHCRYSYHHRPSGHSYGCHGQQSPQIQRRACNTHCCPVDGLWSHWSHWSYTHGHYHHYKKQVRTRTCTRPSPSCGGRQCPGVSTQYQNVYGRY